MSVLGSDRTSGAIAVYCSLSNPASSSQPGPLCPVQKPFVPPLNVAPCWVACQTPGGWVGKCIWCPSHTTYPEGLLLSGREPIYPPSEVSFQVGPTPDRLHAAGKRYRVLATDELQTFVLPASAPVGRYLRVCLHGKRQRQLEDLQFYHALRCASIPHSTTHQMRGGLGLKFLSTAFSLCECAIRWRTYFVWWHQRIQLSSLQLEQWPAIQACHQRSGLQAC